MTLGEPYDATCEVFSFGIVIAELLTGKLQGQPTHNGRKLFLESVIEEVSVDGRAEFPQDCTKELHQLAKDCTLPYEDRIPDMITVMRRLHLMKRQFCTENESRTVEDLNSLKAQLEVMKVQENFNAMQMKRTCVICCYDATTLCNGIECIATEPHFTCNECFSNLLTHQISPESRGDFIKNQCCLVCQIHSL